MRRALITCCHDGFFTQYCGVGTAARKTVDALRTLLHRGTLAGMRLDFIGPALRADSPSYDPAFARTLRTFARSTGGDLHAVRVTPGPLPSDLNKLWGPKQWRVAAEEAAAIILSIPAERKSFFAHDIFFGQLCAEIPSDRNTIGCYVPHSTGKLFGEPVRLKVERRIHHSIVNSQHFVAAINQFMGRHLMEAYGLPRARFLSLTNALTESDRARQENPQKLRADIQRRTEGKRIVFSYGRCGRQKGYHILIPAFRRFVRQHPDYHLVVLAPTDITDLRYLRLIERLLLTLPPGTWTWVQKFSDPLPYLQCPRTQILAFASLFECAPFTPLEALAYAPHATILHSGIAPYEEVFRGHKASTRVEMSVGAWANALSRAAASPPRSMREPKRATYEHCLLKAIQKLSHAHR